MKKSRGSMFTEWFVRGMANTVTDDENGDEDLNATGVQGHFSRREVAHPSCFCSAFKKTGVILRGETLATAKFMWWDYQNLGS
jgi:hypothetical protein